MSLFPMWPFSSAFNLTLLIGLLRMGGQIWLGLCHTCPKQEQNLSSEDHLLMLQENTKGPEVMLQIGGWGDRGGKGSTDRNYGRFQMREGRWQSHYLPA